MIPWWGWLIIAVVALVAVFYGIVLVFFAKTSKRVFRTFDDVSKGPHARRDPFDAPFFKRDHFNDPFFKGQ